MREILLKNGGKEVDTLVGQVMMSLRGLFDNGVAGALAVYDLHEKCKNPDYEIFGPNIEPLENLHLIDSNGTIHNSIKNVVLSAVEGEGMEMALGSPVAEDNDDGN